MCEEKFKLHPVFKSFMNEVLRWTEKNILLDDYQDLLPSTDAPESVMLIGVLPNDLRKLYILSRIINGEVQLRKDEYKKRVDDDAKKKSVHPSSDWMALMALLNGQRISIDGLLALCICERFPDYVENITKADSLLIDKDWCIAIIRTPINHLAQIISIFFKIVL